MPGLRKDLRCVIATEVSPNPHVSLCNSLDIFNGSQKPRRRRQKRSRINTKFMEKATTFPDNAASDTIRWLTVNCWCVEEDHSKYVAKLCTG